MHIAVERQSLDGLTRDLWVFDTNVDMLRLTSFHEQVRSRKAGRFKTEAKWDAHDERSYNSSLQRPTDIPEDVVLDALKKIEIRINIGWTNDDCTIGSRRLPL